jgi:hypothetical protein
MQTQGNLLKMQAVLGSEVEYYLEMEGEKHLVNDWIGAALQIKYLGKINCIHCGAQTKTSFFQGFCYKCYTTLPQTDKGVINPELNQAHLGISRDMEWSKKNDLIDHVVYISATSNLKVGVTRHSQIPTRWIDQGAEYAIKLAVTPYRQLAGLIEVALKPHVKDKTNWRKMLSGNMLDRPDMVKEKERLAELIPEDLKQYICRENEITSLVYPVEQFPEKVKSINLDKTTEYAGVLMGIKGQYLIFEDGNVFNVRKHNGYLVELTVE